MQPRDSRHWLVDIRDACDLILRWASDRTYEQFVADAFGRSAVERQFEIIGEALKRLLASEPGLSLRFGDARGIIGFRNVLAHGYYLIDHARVWQTITQDVPRLRSAADQVLNERPPLIP